MTLDEAYRIAIGSMRQELARIAPLIQDYERGVYNVETRAAVQRRGELSAAVAQLEVQIAKRAMERANQ